MIFEKAFSNMQQVQKQIQELLDSTLCDADGVIYSDEHFVRRKFVTKLTDASEIDVVSDSIANEGVECVFISFCCEHDTELTLLFGDSNVHEFEWGHIVNGSGENSAMFWLPKTPVSRIYDIHKRIHQSNQADVTFSDNIAAAMTIVCPSGMRTEFCLLRFSKDTKQLQLQLTDRDSFEDAEFFRLHRNIFNYKGLCDLWDYLIQGKIYKPSPNNSTVSVQSQHTAYSLYYHMSYLHDRFGKHIYNIARQLVAYAVLLSQDQGGRWKHGLWADKMETHCVFQVSGIDVLVDYYQISGGDIFLEKAKDAADYLVEIADHLSGDMLWFLHDSLELNIDDARLFYKDILPSKSFGKSESNTLCLNSHLGTMIILRRLSKLEGGQRYTTPLQKAGDALKMILTLKPAGFLYGPIYWLRDLFHTMAEKKPCRLTDKLRRKNESFLRKGWLFRLKVRHPRIVMPNGFTERDITASLLMNDYHLVNMRDLLYVYRDVPEQWLCDIIEKCMRYTVQSSVVHNFSRHNPKAAMILDILILYTSMFGEKYLEAFAKYAPLADGFDSGFAIDLVSNPEVAGSWNGLSVSNEDVIMFSIPSKSNLKAVLVNTSESDQLIEIVCQKGKFKDLYTGVDISGKTISLEIPINIRKDGIIKIVKKSNVQ
jgi:hypothetical protein